MSRTIEKVTAFIIRQSQAGPGLLLFEHPYAGIQIPAGTVEQGETPEQAVVREAVEETGLSPLSVRRYLGSAQDKLPPGQRVIAQHTRIYARPDSSSFDWAYLRPGIRVTLLREVGGFSQVTYQEFDREPDPQYVSMSITGWAPDEALADAQRRHFFQLDFEGHSKERWAVLTDNHHFTLFWASLAALPAIIAPQDQWLEFLPAEARAGKSAKSAPVSRARDAECR